MAQIVRVQFRVQNICGFRSKFELLAIEPLRDQPSRCNQEGAPPGFHVLFRINSDGPMEPGQLLAAADDVDIEMLYRDPDDTKWPDVSKVSWHVPVEIRGRFYLAELRWGAFSYLERAGRI